MRPSAPSIVALILLGFLAPAPARATWVLPGEAPVERLLKNAQAWVDANPKDPRGYFVLGRIHSYAFRLNTTHLQAHYSDDEAGKLLPNVSTNPSIQRGPDPKEKDKLLTDEQRRKHLVDSISNFRKSAELMPTSGITRLGLGYVLSAGAGEAIHIGLSPGGAEPAEPTAAQLKTLEPSIKALASANEGQRKAAESKLTASIEQAITLITPLRESNDENVKAAAGRLLATFWREEAIKEYQLAYDYTVAQETKEKLPKLKSNWDVESLVSYEAAQSYLALINGRPLKPAERNKAAQMNAFVKKVGDSTTQFIVTPIIFALDRPRTLEQMLAPKTTVLFDLDGDGKAERWPWVKPQTGFLVWDPRGTGIITNGRQMFGSVTWWMFWRDGYHAMDALDDDRDGELRGDELRGLCVWFDRNSDGISDVGEVVAVSKLEIEAIAVRATGDAGDAQRSPANPRGLRMKDGRELPTYDWMTGPAKPN